MPACCTSLSIGVNPASNRSACSRSPNTLSVSRSPASRSRSRWISLASNWFSRSSPRLFVTVTPRESAVPPSTSTSSAKTLPIPTSALKTVCDTSTARDEPDPCGTSITVQRRSARFFFIWGCKRYDLALEVVKSGDVRSVTFFAAGDLRRHGLGKQGGRVGDPLSGDGEIRDVREPHGAQRAGGAECGPDGFGFQGNERRRQYGEARHGANETRKYLIELRIALRLGEFPRRRLLDITVGARGQLDDERSALLERLRVHGPRICRNRFPRGRLERRVARRRIVGDDGAAITLHHRQGARHEIAKCIGEVGGVTRVEPLPRKVAVALEADLAHQEIAQRVGAVAFDRRTEADGGARRLAHLGAFPLHVAVRPDQAGRLDTGGEQHGRPDDAVKARDALADDVEVGRPQPLVARLGESRGGQIIDQGVEPDIDRLVRIAGEGNAPRQSLAGDRDVLQPVFNQAHHLVAPDLRLDAELAGRDELEEPLAVRAEAEKVIALFGGDEVERGMLDAMPVRDLGRLLELLAAGAIQSLIVRDVQIFGPLLLDALQQRDDAAHVARLRRADPVVVAALEPAPVVGEGLRHPVDPLARRNGGAGRRLNHRLAVLVHPHEKMDLVAAQPVIAGDTVGADFLQGVAEVGIAIGVIDGGSEVEFLARHLESQLLEGDHPRLARFGAKRDTLAEDVHGDHPLASLGRLDRLSFFRKAFALLDVEVMLVVQATQQAAAGTGDLHGVERQALRLREGQADRLPFRQPARDAELAAAAPDAVEALRLVARADLPQLDARPKQTREVAHQRPEVHPLLGGEVNRELALVPLPFGVGDLHREIVLPHTVPYSATHLFFVESQVRGRLPIFGRRQADDGARGRARLLAARAAALTLFLCHATQCRHDPEILSALYLDDYRSIEAQRRGVFGRPDEIFSPVPF